MKRETLVVALAAVIIFWALGSHDLWAPDEPFFAEGAREMLVDGHWAVPHVNGKLNNHKPALFFWLIALASLPGGAVTSLTARLPSAFAAVGTLLLVIRLGRRLYGPKTAALATMILSTTYLFWAQARTAQIDATLCFFIWLALAAFLEWRSGFVRGRTGGLVLWIAAGFAVLAKGPVGLVLIGGIVLVTLVTDGRLGRFKDFAPILGPVVFVMIVGAWMVIATVGSGGEYSVFGALKEHVIDRGIHGMHHKQPFWYYGHTLPVLLMPWTALAVGGAVLAWRRRAQSAERFWLAAAAFIVALFSISTEKRGLYILPAMPAFAFMVARLLTAARPHLGDTVPSDSEAETGRRLTALAQGLTGALLLLAGLLIPFQARQVEVVSQNLALFLALTLAATGITVVLMVLRGQSAQSAAVMAAGIAMTYILTVTFVYPALEPQKSARAYAVKLRETTATSRSLGNEIIAYDLGNVPNALAFYSDGVYTKTTNDPDVLANHLSQDTEVYAIVNAQVMKVLDEDSISRVAVHHSGRLSRKEVLLVSNLLGRDSRTHTDEENDTSPGPSTSPMPDLQF